MFEREFKVKNARPANAGLAFPFILTVIMWIVSLGGQSACAQWEAVGTFPHQISNVYFLNEFGHPEIGFVGMFTSDTVYPGSIYARDSTDLWRTSDGGRTWNPIALSPDLVSDYFSCRDFTFKDSLNGWMTSWNCYRTTDGGITWSHLPADVSGQEAAIFYHQVTKLLFMSVWSYVASNYVFDSTIVSGNDGSIWNNLGAGHNGYSFSGLNGVIAPVGEFPAVPALYTNDGGLTWAESNFTDECWQPTCIPGTSTFFAASERQNRISRSNDGGKTWSTIFIYSPPSDQTKRLNGCIRIDHCENLYVLTLSEGLLMSSDEGISWPMRGRRCKILDHT